MVEKDIDLLKLAEKIGLKGSWRTNALASDLVATPDGKGYQNGDFTHASAVIGEPLRPIGSLLFKDEAQAADGIVGIYDRVASFENLLKDSADKKIRFGGDELIIPDFKKIPLDVIPEEGLKIDLLNFQFDKK